MYRHFIHFLIFSNLWVSLASGTLGAAFFAINGIEINYFWLLFISSNTLIAYNLQRLFKEKWPTNSLHFKWIQNNKKTVYLLMFLSSIYSLYFTLQLNLESLFLFGAIGMVSFFYSGSWNKKGYNLRRLPYLKIYIIAVSWVAMTVVLPWFETGFINIFENSLLILSIFLLIVGMTIPFDIRDLKFDNIRQRTIPQLLGMRLSKVISISLVVLSLVLLLYLSQLFNILLVVSGLFTIFIISRADSKKSEFYYSGLLEGTITLIGLSFIVFYG